MNRKKFLLKGIAAIAVILCFAQCKDNKASQQSTSSTAEAKNTELKIAYIEVDSLLSKYQLSIDLNEAIIKKTENVRLTLNQKAGTLAKEKGEFQSKMENNAFLSKERAEQEYTRLLKKEQELQELGAKLQKELEETSFNNTIQLRDSISSFLKEYNADKKYSVIFSKTGFENIIMADPSFNITNEVIEALNSRYTPAKK